MQMYHSFCFWYTLSKCYQVTLTDKLHDETKVQHIINKSKWKKYNANNRNEIIHNSKTKLLLLATVIVEHSLNNLLDCHHVRLIIIKHTYKKKKKKKKKK